MPLEATHRVEVRDHAPDAAAGNGDTGRDGSISRPSAASVVPGFDLRDVAAEALRLVAEDESRAAVLALEVVDAVLAFKPLVALAAKAKLGGPFGALRALELCQQLRACATAVPALPARLEVAALPGPAALVGTPQA